MSFWHYNPYYIALSLDGWGIFLDMVSNCINSQIILNFFEVTLKFYQNSLFPSCVIMTLTWSWCKYSSCTAPAIVIIVTRLSLNFHVDIKTYNYSIRLNLHLNLRQKYKLECVKHVNLEIKSYFHVSYNQRYLLCKILNYQPVHCSGSIVNTSW